MAYFPILIYLSFFYILCFALRIHARVHLHQSETDALILFKNDLNFNGQIREHQNPCKTAGVHCSRSSGIRNELRVTRIVLDSKGFNGFLSPAVGIFLELKELSLPNNQLVDQVPAEISNCRKLQVLNLENNRLSGKIPTEFSYLVNLRVLDLSSNRLSGDLSFLKYLQNLEMLDLSDNLFTGKVPESLQSLPRLEFLNLSGNKYLELPQHESSTSLPKRYIFAENSGSPSTDKNSTTPHEHKKKKKNFKAWIVGFIVGVIGGVASGFFFSLVFKLIVTLIRGKGKVFGITIFSPLIKKAEDLSFLEKEDGLASLDIIGRGGCGEVYKSELPGSNGKMIAIKKIIHSQIESDDLDGEDSKILHKKMRQIRSEIQTVGRIRHRNLIPLLAHVSRPDCHYLVYEYMKNGSLHDILKQVSDGTRELDWLSRHRIALGVAAGLEYLHMNHSPRIIHRDLKPGNILLDDDMEARIADFGLAKSVPDANTHVSASSVAGTIGYIAPEYHQTLKFTDKCDIYSFGVVLAVLGMGKLPSDGFFQDTHEMSQLRWLKNVITSENPKRAIDPDLLGNGFEEQMLLVLKIACFCTQDDPKQRPNSKDVRCMLDQVKH